MEKYKNYFLSIMEAFARKIPRHVDQYLIILNAKNVTTEHADLGFLQFEIDILQNHYPERLHKLFAINMDWFSRAIWHTVKHFIRETTRKKINMFGDNENEYMEALSKEIDKKYLPKDIGGEASLNLEF
jgi:serine kinase of HPr protein (carbohydrate metabolism regulator)